MKNAWRELSEDKPDEVKPLRYPCMGRRQICDRNGRPTGDWGPCGVILDEPLSRCPVCVAQQAEHMAKLAEQGEAEQ